jgi:hypothetical protein
MSDWKPNFFDDADDAGEVEDAEDPEETHVCSSWDF